MSSNKLRKEEIKKKELLVKRNYQNGKVSKVYFPNEVQFGLDDDDFKPPTDFKGTIFASGGISGSITKLVDGNSYLRAGAGILIVTNSDDSITISAGGDLAGLERVDTVFNVSLNTPRLTAVGIEGTNFSEASFSPNYIDVYYNGQKQVSGSLGDIYGSAVDFAVIGDSELKFSYNLRSGSFIDVIEIHNGENFTLDRSNTIYNVTASHALNEALHIEGLNFSDAGDSTNYIDVYYNGQKISSGTASTVAAGTQDYITFGSSSVKFGFTATSGSVVDVLLFNTSSLVNEDFQISRLNSAYTLTASHAALNTLPIPGANFALGNYNQDYIDVYYNGLKQRSGSLSEVTAVEKDYTIVGTDGIKFAYTAASASIVDVTILSFSSASAPANASYVVLSAHSGLSNERVLTAGAGITLNDAGAGGALTISAPALGNPHKDHFSSSVSGFLTSTGSTSFAGNLGYSHLTSNIGTDTFFFVSGTQGSKDSSTRGAAVFGGDVVISGTLYGGSPLIIGGELKLPSSSAIFEGGISGSLTRLHDGTSAFIAGDGMIITSESNGSVTITSNAGELRSKIFYDVTASHPANNSVVVPGIDFSTVGYEPNRIDIILNGAWLRTGSSNDYVLDGTGSVKLNFDLSPDDVLLAVTF